MVEDEDERWRLVAETGERRHLIRIGVYVPISWCGKALLGNDNPQKPRCRRCLDLRQRYRRWATQGELGQMQSEGKEAEDAHS